MKNDPTDASAPFNPGNMLRAGGRNVEAEAALRAATRTDPTFAEAWYAVHLSFRAGLQPGYAPMLARLHRQDGHSPLESGKARQRPIERTGCPYADAILIPALRTSRQFVDQE